MAEIIPAAEDSVEHLDLDAVIAVATEEFSRRGFADTKLDTISKLSGMSKRMIHYHFTDKLGLYQRCLGRSAELLTHNVDHIETESSVPVEGVRKLIDALYARYVAHPECLRLVAVESKERNLPATLTSPLADLSAVFLRLDQLLMTGQDSGAFRPGISAHDVFTMIAAMSSYRTNNQAMLDNLVGVDLDSEDNIEGLHRLIVDAVLAFLTANIPDTGQQSYLVAHQSEDSTAADDIYA